MILCISGVYFQLLGLPKLQEVESGDTHTHSLKSPADIGQINPHTGTLAFWSDWP